eukprot:gb/GEZN01002260.1/.p1 GENE.gb/GEZN01002260.1/~~gb/GEZN01002260.1/.p1  ORF type:complete len:612 (+),score=103.17 gb/GEZN01002260.1/:329-2164(+)
MSFFDDVESTIADTRIVQALRDDARVELKLQPYTELKEFETTYREQFPQKDLFAIRTCRYYEFKRYLRSAGDLDWVELLESIDMYSGELYSNRKKTGKEIYERWLMNLDKAVEATEDAVRVPDGIGDAGDAEPGTTGAQGQHPSGDHDASSSKKNKKNRVQRSANPDRVRWILKRKLAPEIPDKVRDGLHSCLRGLFLPVRRVCCAHLQSQVDQFYGSEMWKRLVQVESYATRKLGPHDFFEFRVVGRGAFGAVSAVQKMDTQATYAMKEMNKRQVKARKSEWIVTGEKNVLAAMDSEFVLSLMYAFHDENSLFFIFELCPGGDLNFHLKQDPSKRFHAVRACFYAAETLIGLEHIHSRGFVYRDLKPHNLLLDKVGHVKISDLGLALKLQENKILKQLAGTAGYWAPEILSKTGTYKTSDIWSFGVFLYRMLKGSRPQCRCQKGDVEWCPFGNSPQMEKNSQSEHGVLTYLVNYQPKYFSPEAKDLLSRIFVSDPKMRLGAGGYDELYQHPFFADIDWEKLRDKAVTPPFKPHEYSQWPSIAEVGTMDVKKYKKIKLTEKDHAHYDTFYHVNKAGYQAELAKALAQMDSPESRDHNKNQSSSNCACCTVL